MFPMTITVHDKSQLNAILAALSSDSPITAPATTTAKSETTTKKSTSAQTTEKPAPTQRTAEAGADAAHESKAGNSDAAQSGNSDAQPDRTVVADAIKKLAPKNRDALVEILAKHGGKHLNDITADKWAALLADLNKALA